MTKILFVLLILFAPLVQAHKMAPSLLHIEQQADGSLAILWKTPIAITGGRSLQPVFPANCIMLDQLQHQIKGTAAISRWTLDCGHDLTGTTLKVDGMAESRTVTLVKIEWQGERRLQRLLSAAVPRFEVPAQQSVWQVMGEYFQLGAEHIWSGIDHLLFLLGLLLLVPNRRLLIYTITSFTVGHSITLSAVSLGYLDWPVALVEFAIAASIFVVAVELSLVRSKSVKNYSRWIPSHSWLVAIAFGLLHGMGFAGALKEVGLPSGDIPLALLSFNIGIEIGQIVFVATALTVALVGRRWAPLLVTPTWWITVYGIGMMSVYWCIERGLTALV